MFLLYCLCSNTFSFNSKKCYRFAGVPFGTCPLFVLNETNICYNQIKTRGGQTLERIQSVRIICDKKRKQNCRRTEGDTDPVNYQKIVYGE